MWARSEAGLSRLPVTEKIAGSNPVGPAKKVPHRKMGFFLYKEYSLINVTVYNALICYGNHCNCTEYRRNKE